jgi:hypothetical protein
MNHKIKMKWLIIILWLALIFKEIAWYGIGLEFWRQWEWGGIVYYGLPITIIMLGLVTLSLGIPGLRHPDTKKLSIVSVLSALICSSLGMIGLWGVVHG